MELREELYPTELDDERVDELTQLCDEIITQVVYGGENPVELLDEFNRRTGHLFGPFTFHSIHGSEDASDFVERLLTDDPDPPPSISREEAVEMVRRIETLEEPQRIRRYWVEMLSDYYDANIHNMLYWPEEEMSAEELVEKARETDNQPIQLGTDRDDDAPETPASRAAAADPSDEDRKLAESFLRELARRELVVFAGDGIDLVEPVARILALDSDLGTKASQISKRVRAPKQRTPVEELFADDAELEDLLEELTKTSGEDV